MLLSVDWDAYSGTRELVFDAPIWGTPDRPHDRLEAWHERARKRGAQGRDWSVLEADFPLYPGWEALARYAGLPAFMTLSHVDAWTWLEQFPGQDVLNIDSHHDLSSFSGNGARLRPGNWAGLGLREGMISHYTCQYPQWHASLPVAEGHDLDRTRTEMNPLLPGDLLSRVALTRHDDLPGLAAVSSVLLVQSPAWTSPAHDNAFFELASWLGCTPLVPPMDRR